jgi:hypothetical protein
METQTHVLDQLSHWIREHIEPLVLVALHRHSENAEQMASHLVGSRGIKRLDRACVCRSCLDIVSRSHSAQASKYRKHEHKFVHHWLIDRASDNEALFLPREVPLGGFAAEYLVRLEKQWLQGEEKVRWSNQYCR